MELKVGMMEEEAWTWQETVGVRTMAEPKGRRSPMKTEGWKVEAKLLTLKFVMMLY